VWGGHRFALCEYLYGVSSSTDGGQTWDDRSSGIPQDCADYSQKAIPITLDPRNPEVLYYGHSSGVSKTTNGGRLWVSSGVGLPVENGFFVFSIVVSPHDSNIVLAGYKCDSTTVCPGLYKSIDAGGSWSAVGTGLPQSSIVGISFDPTNPAKLYLATNDAGVFQSSDGGSTWNSLNTGLGELTVSTVAVSQSGLKLYTATSGGVYSFDVPSGILATPPTAPLTLSATAGNQQATISFSPPASNGGAAIQSYTVTSNPEGHSVRKRDILRRFALYLAETDFADGNLRGR
jgi:hypothetical protein